MFRTENAIASLIILGDGGSSQAELAARREHGAECFKVAWSWSIFDSVSKRVCLFVF